MELKQFVYSLKKNLLLIIFFGILGMGLSVVFTIKFSSGYRQSQLFYIVAPQESGDFSDYFSQEKARNFTDSAVAILQSPDFLADSDISSNIAVRKIAPQIIRISATSTDPNSPQESIEKIASFFNRKQLDLAGEERAVTIKPVAKIQAPIFAGPDKKVWAAFGLICGIVFAILAIGLRTYFKV